ncbi:unnamed protein product [Candida verbasci]|uniref:2-dehydropantoate 2-reductase n=1 Tax=Candida verbasci TaxID=1227364 RepID=A0A9W4TVI3_9ASCO|nr:unnamed protein product [Candida verbasci]
MIKVLIIGSGGVGVMSALALTNNNKCEVTLVVRSDYNLILSQGYSINSCTFGEFSNWKPHNLASSVEDANQYGPFDYIVLSTKNVPDGPITCENIIKPAIHGSETIILLQNGIHIEDAMFKAYPDNLILSGVSITGSTYYDGHVENVGKDQIYLGDFKTTNRNSDSDAKIHQYMELYQDPNGHNFIEVDENVQKTRWEKLIYNSVFNCITALVNLDVNRLQINNLNEELIKPAMYEVIKIAKTEGIECDESKIETYIHIGDGLFYSPSMCVDMRKGQLMELEIILGNPIKIARKNNVSVPILSTIYSLLKCVQFRLKEEKGLLKINQDDFKGNSNDYAKIFNEKYV